MSTAKILNAVARIRVRLSMDFKELGKSGQRIPVLGLGTYGIGGLSSYAFGEEGSVRALRLGLELEMSFIDTAEIYASGRSEEVVAKAIKGQREKVFVATKVSSDHLHYDGVIKACESSLERLQTSHIDLYQVHWPNPRIPIAETMKAMEHLVAEGKIHYIGVSNFSVEQTKEAQDALSRNSLASNQVEYSLLERSIEDELLPYAEKERITIIAYTPIAKGQFSRGGRGEKWQVLDQIASKYGKSRIQVALNWLIAKQPVVAIPKAANLEHVRENAGAAGWQMTKDDQDVLSEAFR
jgi:diketogulonate reductase-like aldo/keto reductase